MFDKLNNPRWWGVGLLSTLGGVYFARKAVDVLADLVLYPVLTNKYEENIWGMKTSLQRFSTNKMVETELRSHTDTFIERPIGGPKRYTYLDQIMLNSAQLGTLPAPGETKINTSVVVGPCAKKPLYLDIPILIGGMAYGLALTEAYKIAFARGANAAGTCTNTGQGPFFEAEREEARKLIIQYSRMKWNKDEKILRQGDAIEIQFGHGANAGVGKTKKAKYINKTLQKRLGLKKYQDAVLHNRMEGVTNKEELRALVEYIRKVTGGVPVGVKIAAGKYLEDDLKIITGAGVDFVSVDGAEGGTHGSLPVFQDDFGLPTFIATARAAKFWRENNLNGKVTLLVGGGINTPGDCVKIMALGADAVYMGVAILLATTHTQVLKVLPFEPPSQISYEGGKKSKQFNIDKGAKSLTRFFNATVYEMEEAVKGLGKTSVNELTKDDIFTIDRDVAGIAGIDLGFYEPKR